MAQDVQEMPDARALGDAVVEATAGGDRFAGMYVSATPAGDRLTAVVAAGDGYRVLRTALTAGAGGVVHYPALTPRVLPAFWYERALHDLSGVVPDGHPRLDPLLLLPDGRAAPRPGGAAAGPLRQHTPPGPVDVAGPGVFTLPLGPVRSGVYESVEFLIESLGEDIPHLNIRPHYKHRGVAKRFEGKTVADGVLVAERVEGIASVAHALAFCHAVEQAAGVTVPPAAGLIRVVHAELERIANHLDVMIRLAEAAGFAVSISRFAWHKECVMRLCSDLCGSRFGRGVVVPGGVAAPPRLAPAEAAVRLREIWVRIHRDELLAMKTPSFLDRLRGTGVLTPQKARAWAALGPIARASGMAEDLRQARPTDAYPRLPQGRPAVREAGDVLARTTVRWEEIERSVALTVVALQELAGLTEPALAVPLGARPTGFCLGWAEAPQGEVLYAVDLADGRIARCFARSASLHNLVTFHEVFNGDVYTDFAFIEASFGSGYAGVAM